LDEHSGSTVKSAFDTAVPLAVVMLIFPVVAPTGTRAVAKKSFLTLNDVATFPLNSTMRAPVKATPLKVTRVPTVPVVGLTDPMTGFGPGAMTLKEAVTLWVVPKTLLTATEKSAPSSASDVDGNVYVAAFAPDMAMPFLIH